MFTHIKAAGASWPGGCDTCAFGPPYLVDPEDQENNSPAQPGGTSWVDVAGYAVCRAFG